MDKRNIRLLVLDVDGTLTDGKIYLDAHGREMKTFNVKDGYGIKHNLPKMNIQVAILTGRQSEIVEIRARELDISCVLQGCQDKLGALQQLLEACSLSGAQVAYMGDDLNDLDAMQLCGIKACPADAATEIIEICDFVAVSKGGEGAVREFIDWLEKQEEC